MKRNIKLLAYFNFFTDLRFYSAILILYFVKVTGSFALAMSVFSVTYIASAFFEIPTGIFSDRIGRKKTIILGAVSSIIAVIFYAIGMNFWFLIIGAIFEGLTRSWYSGNNDAFLHNTLTQIGKKELYDHYLGRVSSMFQWGLMLGAVSGGFLAYFSYSYPMWLSVIPQIICLILAIFMIEPKVVENASGNIYSHLHLSALNLFKNKNLRLLSLNSIISFGIGESTFNFRAAFIKTIWPVWAIGLMQMLSNLGAAISYWYSGKILKKVNAFTLQLLANAYNRSINIIALLFPTTFSPILMSSASLNFGVTGVAESMLMQKEYSEAQRATIDSLNSLFGSLFYGVFAIFLGFIGDKVGPAQALLIAQFLYLPTLLINWKLKRMNKVKLIERGKGLIL